MSEPPVIKPKPSPPALSRDDINRFLDAKAPDTKCPSCGNEHLAILSNDDDSVMTGFSLLTGDAFRFPVFAQVCVNCGFSFHFAVQSVLNWLKNQEPKDG